VSSRTKVVNRKCGCEFDVYIGRGSPFGNPHRLVNCPICHKNHTRVEAIKLYRKYFLNKMMLDPHFVWLVQSLKGQTLACWCKPLPCHGDVIVEYLESLES
jgi:hypothetical protein